MTCLAIGAIPGDGIAKDVLPEGMRVLDAAGRTFGFEFRWGCELYAKTGGFPTPEVVRPSRTAVGASRAAAEKAAE